MNPLTKPQWLDFISEQKESGLSIAAFCRDKKISVDNFYYHRRQILKGTPSDNTPFVRAQFKTEFSPIKEPSTLTLNIGRNRLQIPANISPQWLATLMASLA